MLLVDVEEVDALVVSEAVDVASVVVAVSAETRPTLKMPKIKALTTRTLTVESLTTRVFI